MRALLIGPHLSAQKGYAAMARHAAELSANAFAFFTRNPRGGNARAANEADEALFRALRAEFGIGTLVAHAAYTMNPAARSDAIFDFTCRAMAEDIARLSAFDDMLYNVHPGSHGGLGAEAGIRRVARLLNEISLPERSIPVLLETMAGKGNEMGGTFEEIAEIIGLVSPRGQVGVCMDLCHCWDAGYDVRDDLDGVLTRFDRAIGLRKLRAVHLNDSKNERGSRKDRHARIGEGHIGAEALTRAVNHEALRALPFILETPNDDAGWKAEIALMRSGYLQG